MLVKKLATVCCCLLLVCCIECSTAQKSAECVTSPDMLVTGLRYSYAPLVSDDGRNTKVKLRAEVSWDFNEKEGIALDGFAVYLRSVENHQEIAPLDVCTPGPEKFWIYSANQSLCAFPSNCDAGQATYNHTCWCDRACLKVKPECLQGHVTTWSRFGAITVTKFQRSLLFDLDFFKKYLVDVIPYNRQSSGVPGSSLTIPPMQSCEELLRLSGRTEDQVSHVCCRNSADFMRYRSRDIDVTDPVFILMSQKYEMSITWRPPAVKLADRYYELDIYRVDGGTNQLENGNWDEIPATPSNSSLQCDDSSSVMSGKLVNLQPSTSYYVKLITLYDDAGAICDDYTRCYTIGYFQTPDLPKDQCAPSGHLCVNNATCYYDDTNMPTCKCNKGFFGNGKNHTTWGFGSGCTWVNKDFVDTGYELKDPRLGGSPPSEPTPSDKQTRDTEEGSGLETDIPPSFVANNVTTPQPGGNNPKNFTTDGKFKIVRLNETDEPEEVDERCTSARCVFLNNKYAFIGAAAGIILVLLVLLVLLCVKYKSFLKMQNRRTVSRHRATSRREDQFEIINMKQKSPILYRGDGEMRQVATLPRT